VTSAQYVQGTVFHRSVVVSEWLQLFVQILSSLPRINQPSGVCVQYRADHGPTPHAERGSIELPSITLNFFQHLSQNFRLSFLHRFVCHGHRGVQKTLFAGNAAISTNLGLRVIK
jgi:hypothetical protein